MANEMKFETLSPLCEIDASALKITLMARDEFKKWRDAQPVQTQNWIRDNKFKAEPRSYIQIPDNFGKVSLIIVGCEDFDDLYALAGLPFSLPEGKYRLDDQLDLTALQAENMAVGWAMGAYKCAIFKEPSRKAARFCIPEIADSDLVETTVTSMYLVRDMVNAPPNLMGPEEIDDTLYKIATQLWVERYEVTKNTDLKSLNFPAIWTVGRASEHQPRLINMYWGQSGAPRVTLIGKGVSFDSGGLDLKSSAGMKIMKKDMGGAAHAIALARMIMSRGLNVNLRLIIPAVENSVSERSYRVSDIIETRKGITVEVGNTDAEGRLILADALAFASEEPSDIIMDFATLTGAARIALGPELPAMFCDNPEILAELQKSSERMHDPFWHMPLYAPYRDNIKSELADLRSTANDNFGGALIAALFLKEFVDTPENWVHFDVFAWNPKPRLGHPHGGEAQTIRCAYDFLERRFGFQKSNG